MPSSPPTPILRQARPGEAPDRKLNFGAGFGGLDALTDQERERFTDLNDAYVEKFGFPFIMAVKGRSKDEILAAFENRIGNDRETEFVTACRQVERIALLRLRDTLPD